MAQDNEIFPLSGLPEALQDVAGQARERLADTLAQEDADSRAVWQALTPERQTALARVVTVSNFAQDVLVRTPALLGELQAAGELDATPARPVLERRLADALAQADDEETLYAAVRRFRQAKMLGIIWRDLNRPAGHDVWHTTAAVTLLAEVTLEATLAWLEAFYTPRWGRPAPCEDGSAQRLVVLGMGKLGAGELNLSSDIDLIFAYAEDGETHGGRKSLAHQEYFTKIGQKLIAALDSVTADGFAFRVDMRLRPLGDGGPLVGSFAALLAYYQDQGREWERYAMLKARPVAGDVVGGAGLLRGLRPFVYRKYLDFGAIESLRGLKTMIHREVKRRSMESNVKLGPGGIREVEFVVQAFQLIRGGRDTELQQTSLRAALTRLPALGLLPQDAVDELLPDYAFLRDLEHALQALDDRQTQRLPDDPDARERVALALGFADWAGVIARLGEGRERIQGYFDDVIAEPEEDVEDADSDTPDLEQWRQLWRGELTPEAAVRRLGEAGFDDPDGARKRLERLYHSRAVQGMQRIGFERLDALMPLLLDALAQNPTPDTALPRVQPLIEAVLRRTAYLALLRENPHALEHLMRLCAASPWIADQLARYPILLDELLTPESLYTPASKERLADELRQTLNRLPEDDEEAQLEALRVFKHAQTLHVAASDIAGTRHLMNVSDYLTYIAEVILDAVLAMAWKHLTRKHGVPPGMHRDLAEFLVVGYGKLGGIELGYGSDLDLVFLHRATRGATDGRRPVDASVFFTRLGQRMIHLLTAITPAGSLYEVDMRLRPSGNAGLLVTSLAAYADYQRQNAWTWEHQALVRARVVAGDATLAERFNAVRREVLGQARPRPTLRDDVVHMRQRMRAHLSSRTRETFDVKQDAGGMVDIEFLCQYAVLARGAEAPALLTYSDNVRILDTLLDTGYLPADEARELRDAYLAYRSTAHRAALTGDRARVAAGTFEAHRRAVTELWARVFEPAATDEGASSSLPG
ncbi:bifunctional [glutamate--ammonia ligase]-adenylyl-L-tyrosine phosphorylase/[glutamate--ammonia-ligase] adenylyltransferase [Vreelandella jeotgali]|uniref:bifunctional [glutamate--ammonia ligase]-adenylyl-L-tyrosine phosphorylase/[glutamate--ammonia-ligase] adenylyltransferase n=1 Tax=Vreelandella jeotgali TaxID=553386 RepID=UPI0003471EBC|nr:bifunctional [glutamate--ammonia ligase]-adenylyl-L-tyrosine phosphorylase/[glutamate--ammonia-ligase] adenylyltransferase [Halomonas jeotgali]